MTHPWLLAVVAVGIGFLWHQGAPKKAGAGAPGAPKAKMTRADFRRRLPGYLVGVAFLFGGVGWLMHYKVQGILLGLLCLALAGLLTYRDRQKARRRQQLEPVDAAAAGIVAGAKLVTDAWHKEGYLLYSYPPATPDPDSERLQKLVYNLGQRMGEPVMVHVDPATQRFYVRKHQKEQVAAEPPPPPIPHPPNLLRGEMLIPLGVDAAGKVVTWPLSRGLSHLLVGGQTGKGKSSTMRTIITEVCARGVEVYISDVKRISLGSMRCWPGVREVATTMPAIERLMTKMCEEMDRRYEDVEAGRVRRRDLPITMLVLDELADTFDQAVEDHKARRLQGDPPILVKFRRLVRLGSECRIHLLVGTQRPDARIVGGDNRAQFTCRIGVCVEDPDLMRMLRIKQHVTRPLQGRAIVNAGSGDIECQTYWTPEPLPLELTPEDQAILDGLDPAWRIEPQAKVVSRFDEPQGPRSDEAVGAVSNSPKVRLRLVGNDEYAGHDGRDARDEGSEGPSGETRPSDWWCLVNDKTCQAAYRRGKDGKGCRCDRCRAWKSWDNGRQRAAKG